MKKSLIYIQQIITNVPILSRLHCKSYQWKASFKLRGSKFYNNGEVCVQGSHIAMSYETPFEINCRFQVLTFTFLFLVRLLDSFVSQLIRDMRKVWKFPKCYISQQTGHGRSNKQGPGMQIGTSAEIEDKYFLQIFVCSHASRIFPSRPFHFQYL